MKILAFSDIHDEEIALESLIRLAPNYDYVFACGDITHSTLFLEELLTKIPNCFVIPGNWDNQAVNNNMLKQKQCAHEKRVELSSGLNVIGFGYSSPTPYGTYGELSEEEIYQRMSKLHIDSNTLLMLHCPPFGHFDKKGEKHFGSHSILKIIEEKKPFCAFFGHVHELVGTKKLNDTTLIKLPPSNEMRACSLEISGRTIRTEVVNL
ncbi:metallophosphoesterase family protein [Candidatus Micrarchaeota archaeon]|nr:metallophosphoesterase family protein [Candidatus Micrarchaeota archaeon]